MRVMGFEVLVEESQAGPVAVNHDQRLLLLLADSLHRNFVEGAVLAGQFDHGSSPYPRAERIGSVGGGRIKVARRRADEGHEGENIVLDCLRGEARPLQIGVSSARRVRGSGGGLGGGVWLTHW